VRQSVCHRVRHGSPAAGRDVVYPDTSCLVPGHLNIAACHCWLAFTGDQNLPRQATAVWYSPWPLPASRAGFSPDQLTDPASTATTSTANDFEECLM
jgi:hypothetical protein